MILFGTVLQEKLGTIYDHPTTQYEQFIERYYSDGQVILLDIRSVTLWGGGFQLTSQRRYFGK